MNSECVYCMDLSWNQNNWALQGTNDHTDLSFCFWQFFSLHAVPETVKEKKQGRFAKYILLEKDEQHEKSRIYKS